MTATRDRDDSDAKIRKLTQRIDKLERQTAAARTSITRGQFRIASVEGLLVQGSAKVEGLLNGTGTLTWTGPANLNGNTVIGGTLVVSSTATLGGNTTINGVLVVNAATDLKGNTTISGTLGITGNVTVTGDLNVTGGGVIRAGAVTISPANGGRVQVGGLTIASDGTLSNSASGVGVQIQNGLRVFDGIVTPGNLLVSGGTVALANLPADPGGTVPLRIGVGGFLYRGT